LMAREPIESCVNWEAISNRLPSPWQDNKDPAF
jgi:hypothetical protein